MNWRVMPEWLTSQSNKPAPYDISHQTRDVHPKLVWCWATIADGGPTLPQHWCNASCSLGAIMRYSGWISRTLRALAPSFEKRTSVEEIGSKMRRQPLSVLWIAGPWKHEVLSDVGLMLRQRRRRWRNINTASRARLMSTSPVHVWHLGGRGPMINGSVRARGGGGLFPCRTLSTWWLFVHCPLASSGQGPVNTSAEIWDEFAKIMPIATSINTAVTKGRQWSLSRTQGSADDKEKRTIDGFIADRCLDRPILPCKAKRQLQPVTSNWENQQLLHFGFAYQSCISCLKKNIFNYYNLLFPEGTAKIGFKLNKYM